MKGCLQEQDFYGLICDVLFELGGSARARDVLERVGERVSVAEADLQALPVSGQLRWINRARWARKRLIGYGLLRVGCAWGWWELTDEGHMFAELRVVPTPPPRRS